MSSANFGVLLRCKVIVVGDAGVGKSAIVQMFHSKGSHYPRQYNMTTGCDFVMKEIKVPESDYTVELHIYDCAGQSVFKDLTSQYWKNSNIVIFVYDVTKPESFQNLGEWLDLVRKKCPEKVLPGVYVDLFLNVHLTQHLSAGSLPTRLTWKIVSRSIPPKEQSLQGTTLWSFVRSPRSGTSMLRVRSLPPPSCTPRLTRTSSRL